MAQELVSASTLIFTATLLAALSGAPLLVPRLLSASRGQLLATVLMLAASALGLSGALLTLLSGRSEIFQLAWTLPFGPAEIGIDPLSAWFLLPIFLIPGCAALYARSYWHADHYPANCSQDDLLFRLDGRLHERRDAGPRRHHLSVCLGDHGPGRLLSGFDRG